MDSPSNGFDTNGHHSTFQPQQRQITVHDYMAMLYRGKWVIIGIFVAMVACVSYFTFTTPRTYQASTTIIIDEGQGVGQSIFEMTGFRQKNTLILNQVEILKSRFLAEATVERLLVAPERDSLSLLKGVGTTRPMASAVEKLRKMIIVTPVRNTDLIKIDVQAGSPFETAFLANSVAESYKMLDRDFSRGEITQVVKFLETQLGRKAKDLKTSEDALKQFMRREKIASLGEEASQVVEQSARFESMHQEAEIDLEVTRKRLGYLKTQLGTRKETLEREIARVSSPLILQLREEIAEIERTIAVYLSQGVSEDDPQVVLEQERSTAIKKRLTEETRKLLVDGLPPNDPLARAQGLVVKILEAETEMVWQAAKAGALARVVDRYSGLLEALPDKNVQLARLERSRRVDENLYMMMREKFEESRITQAGQIGKVRIIDYALPPSQPIAPRVRLNLILGVILGLGLGVAITLLREYLDTSVHRVEDIEANGVNVLGAIPRIGMQESRDGLASATRKNLALSDDGDKESARRLVTHLKPKSPVSEAYRTIRTNLQFVDPDKPIKSILVTSAGPGEGKSTTAANLAIALGQQGVRVILVDSDLRRPVIHRLMQVRKKEGLSNVLVGKLTLDEAIQSTSIPNLDVLACGVLPPNPAEMLGSQRMKDVIRELEDRYDVCLFDSPPLIAVTDPAVLGTVVDGVLFVVKSGQTQRDILVRGIEALQNVRARILGAVLNDVSRSNTYGSYYYYYHYYYYYSSDDDGGGTRKKRRPKSKGQRSRSVALVRP